MAKKKSIEESETTKGIGEQVKSKLTQRDRNLAVKAEMIERGERKDPTSYARTQKEKNLEAKKLSEDEKAKESKK